MSRSDCWKQVNGKNGGLEEQVNAPVNEKMHSEGGLRKPPVQALDQPEKGTDQMKPIVPHTQICRKLYQIIFQEVENLGSKFEYGRCTLLPLKEKIHTSRP